MVAVSALTVLVLQQKVMWPVEKDRSSSIFGKLLPSLQKNRNRHQLTHTHTQLFYVSVEFVRDNPGEPVPEETFTHYTRRGHQSSLSAFSIYYDTWHPPAK